jgi:hypothetical protein
MPFDDSTLEGVSDLRYDILKKKVQVDQDNKGYELLVLAPGSIKGAYNVTGYNTPACWNYDSSLRYFDVICPSDAKAFMSGLMVRINFSFAEQRTAASPHLQPWNNDTAANGRLTGVTTAIPWNPLHIFRTTSLKVNNGLIPVEQYINDGQFGHATTLRFIRQYSNQALEMADDSFFTPCIESSLDRNIAPDANGQVASTLSTETQQRSLRWCIPAANQNSSATVGANLFVKCSKIIPFSMLFESCSVPSIWSNTSRFRWEFTLKTPDQVPINMAPATLNAINGGVVTGHSPGVVPYVFIEDIELMYDSTRMSPSQYIETSTEKASGSVETLGYLYNEVFPVSYSAGSQVVLTNQKNIQMFSLAFPAAGRVITAGATYYVNPYQYLNNGITSLSATYGNDVPLKQPILLSPSDAPSFSLPNSFLYALYRKCAARESTRQLTPAVPFRWMNQYHIYWIPVFYQCGPSHITNDPRDIRIYALGGTQFDGAILCTTKLEVTQIASTGDVASMGK